MKNKIAKYIYSSLLALTPTALLWGQDQAANPYFYDQLFANGLIFLTVVVALAAIGGLFYLLNIMVKVQQIRIYEEQGIQEYIKEVKKPRESLWSRLYKRMTMVVPVEKEKDILFDHEYDGIRELDNSLPPWWVAMFYITIGFAVVYLGYYHVSGSGPNQAEEYEIAMQEAEESVRAYLAKQANVLDENNLTLLEDENDIAMGKSLYEINCAACHGMLGEGGIGPNLTDNYWLHGGHITDVFKTIKNGVPEKGMIAWKNQMRPVDIHKLSSYILGRLHGTSPPNPKAPEGELIEGGSEGASDSEDGETIGMN